MNRSPFLQGLCAALAVAQSLSVPTLLQPRGLDFQLRNSPTPQKYLIETMAGGVALLDYDNDGLLDIFCVNGGKIDAAAATAGDFARRDPQYWNRLYRQNRDGSFTDVTAAAGLDRAPNVYGMGVAAGDYDNDGFTDLYVTAYGSNTLYRNNGRGGFEDITAKAGVAGAGWSASAGFFDFDNDGKLDLFVTRDLEWDIHRNILCGTPFNAYCRPGKFPPVSNLLFHNEGAGRFRDVSAESGIAASKGKSLGVAFADYDADGLTDILVANDGMEQFLFHNLGNGKFEERAIDAGVAYGDDGKTYAGMGVAFQDYDNDGRPDIAVTNLALEKYALYRNEGGGQFRYETLHSGLAAASARSSGWGVALADFDNDGWKDLFVAQSHVLDNVDKIHSGLRYPEPLALYWNRSGKFARSDLGGPLPYRGAAFGDIDNDGAIDAVVTVLGGRPYIVKGAKTTGNKAHWLEVKLEGRKSNRQGLGAKVRAAGAVHAIASTAGSYLSASDSRVHLGLGASAATTVDLQIVWPSGIRQELKGVPVNHQLSVKEPEQ